MQPLRHLFFGILASVITVLELRKLSAEAKVYEIFRSVQEPIDLAAGEMRGMKCRQMKSTICIFNKPCSTAFNASEADVLF
jgi:hypothetical protein